MRMGIVLVKGYQCHLQILARPNMRFVAVKSESQQAVRLIQRMHDQLVPERLALMIQIRSYLIQIGIVIAQGRPLLATRR